MRELAYKYALKNALDYGKAERSAVLGKVVAENPELRDEISKLMPLVDEAVKKVNSMSRRELEKEIKNFEFKEKKVEKMTALPELENAEKVILRFAPNPSGPLHIGHCRAAVLNQEYAKKYKGKLILRFEDTDPDRVNPEAYDMIVHDLEWLGIEAHEAVVQSERLEIYYEHAKKLVERGSAYVCTCKQSDFKESRDSGKPCRCRNRSVEENLKKFSKMFSDYREGEAVLRLKTGLELPDPPMREFPILRIVERPHPRAGDKRVYPLYNFSVAVDDHLLGVTHVLRGKDHIANTKKQEFIYNYFNWKKPTFIHYGLLKIEGLELSTSLMDKDIKRGVYTGWDDARLGTLLAMRRRGIQPEAIRKAMLDVGIKDTDINFSWKNLYAYNRALIDRDANRYFFVDSPKEVIVEGAIKKKPEALLHPDFPERGKRMLEFPIKDGKARFFISVEDFSTLRGGDFVRLMEAFNIEVLEKGAKIRARFHSEALEEARKRKAPLIQWVSGKSVKVKVVMPDGELKGLGEENLRKLHPDDIVQFERFGFVRIDSIGEEIVSYFAHK
ncbi:MAG: glutamate--tRNA ligase [Candidatus Hydrothermarchaeaceae archaeon]